MDDPEKRTWEPLSLRTTSAADRRYETVATPPYEELEAREEQSVS